MPTKMSKGKLILTVIYFILIAVAIYFVTFYSAASNAHDFLWYYQDQVEDINNPNNNEILISSAIVANSRGGMQSFIQSEPVLIINAERADIYFYSLVQFNDNVQNNTIAIILRNISLPGGVNDERLFIDDLRWRFSFPELVNFGNLSQREFVFRFSHVFDEPTMLQILNYDHFIGTISQRPSFSEMIIEHVSPNGDVLVIHRFLEEELLTLSADSFNLLIQYNRNNFQTGVDDGILFFADGMKESYGDFNQLVIHLLIAIAIIVPITYFIYFHKHVVNKIKYNISVKKDKKKQIEQTPK